MKRNRRFLALAILFGMASCMAQAGPVLVYVTDQGKKYHVKTCRLKHGSKGIPLAEAKRKGYKPCAVCKPPK